VPENAQNSTHSLEKFGKSLSLRRVYVRKTRRKHHRSYTKPGVTRPIVIPTYDEVPVSIIRNNLKTAGITREEFFILLEEK
jgi:hypothetical protein